jgi:hypothetical protein
VVLVDCAADCEALVVDCVEEDVCEDDAGEEEDACV